MYVFSLCSDRPGKPIIGTEPSWWGGGLWYDFLEKGGGFQWESWGKSGQEQITAVSLVLPQDGCISKSPVNKSRGTV